MSGNCWVKSGHVNSMWVDGSVAFATTTSTGAAVYKDSPKATIQATVVGTGAVTATVVIDCSNDGTNWCSTALGTITLSGTTSSSDGFTTDAPWKYVRARVTAISGTGATVTCLIGV